MHTELFSYVLVRGNRVIPVGNRAQPILDALDGRSTLRQIEERFGQKALDFGFTVPKRICGVGVSCV
jgi:hypothetical protein